MLDRARILDDRCEAREDHFVFLQSASWADYLRILRIRGERSVPRITYLEGNIEIMSPSRDHETIRSHIGRLVEAYCLENGIEFQTLGSRTLKRRKEERGVEPDECYVFGTKTTDRPDLAIEVEWSGGGIDKLDVYRKLGVREVWVWRRGCISVHGLRGDRYVRRAASRLLPRLDLALLVRFLDRPTTSQAIREYRAALKS